MSLAGKVWNTLSVIDRLSLLASARRGGSSGILEHEAKLQWDKLLPSTQLDLLAVDWSVILGRDVTP